MPASSFAVKPLVQFQIGRIYKRKTDIHEPFGGSFQSGIAPSNVVDAVFIFTGESGEQFGYHDSAGVDANGVAVFRYTGEGQVGDMKFTNGNKAIREHSSRGRALHLFRALGKSKGHEYLGEFVCARHEIVRGPDRDGNERDVIVFHLVTVSALEAWEDSDELFEFIEPEPMTLAQARALAIVAASGEGAPAGQSAVRNVYARSTAVKRYVLMRAAGICESCHQPAPFERANGSPYLEPHHTTRLSDGGADHPRFVGAICPACHREIHHGKNGVDKNAVLKGRLLRMEK